MLLYPAMNNLLERIPSRYMLVNVVASRARKIATESEQTGMPLTDKPVSMAVWEVANGTLTVDLDEETVDETEIDTDFLAIETEI